MYAVRRRYRAAARSLVLSITMEPIENDVFIRLEGTVNVTSAAELKGLLIEGLASGSNLRLDLQQAEEIDITIMQLLWATGREAGRTGASIAMNMPEAVRNAAREAGFGHFPGLTDQG